MLTKEYKILELFARAPWNKYTFTDILNKLKLTSKSYLALTLKRLIDDAIIKKELVGNLPIYSLNISSSKARLYAGFVLEYVAWGRKNIPYTDIEKLIKKIPTKDFIFIITGSYSQNKQTEKSDIDVVILVDNSVNVKTIYAELNQICELNIPLIHLYVFKNREFLEMLINDDANYGKEIVRNNLVINGGQIYLSLIYEATRNGFTNKNTY